MNTRVSASETELPGASPARQVVFEGRVSRPETTVGGGGTGGVGVTLPPSDPDPQAASKAQPMTARNTRSGSGSLICAPQHSVDTAASCSILATKKGPAPGFPDRASISGLDDQNFKLMPRVKNRPMVS